MILLAQQGALEGDKIYEGLKQSFINGAILSPKDYGLKKQKERILKYREIQDKCFLLFDPQYYAAVGITGESHKLGNLLEEYSSFFQLHRRAQLEREATLQNILDSCFAFQKELKPLSAVVAPNILISRSFDSIEAVAVKNFIRLAGSRYAKCKDKRELYVTLAISREALFDKNILIEFVNEITMLDDPPDGFYILIAGRSSDARSEIFNADVIAASMFLTYSLSLNGFRVVNGYSDLLAPFLSTSGSYANATGWWTNLRCFSLDRFRPSSTGGRLPVQRYLSKVLLNRITFFELNQLREYLPEILNQGVTDSFYPQDGEPERKKEILQSWESLNAILKNIPDTSISDKLQHCQNLITNAEKIYDKIPSQIGLDTKSNSNHLPALKQALEIFKDLGELDI